MCHASVSGHAGKSVGYVKLPRYHCVLPQSRLFSESLSDFLLLEAHDEISSDSFVCFVLLWVN